MTRHSWISALVLAVATAAWSAGPAWAQKGGGGHGGGGGRHRGGGGGLCVPVHGRAGSVYPPRPHGGTPYGTPTACYQPVATYAGNEQSGPEMQRVAMLAVRVPPNADLWFDQTQPQQKGSGRIFM